MQSHIAVGKEVGSGDMTHLTLTHMWFFHLRPHFLHHVWANDKSAEIIAEQTWWNWLKALGPLIWVMGKDKNRKADDDDGFMCVFMHTTDLAKDSRSALICLVELTFTCCVILTRSWCKGPEQCKHPWVCIWYFLEQHACNNLCFKSFKFGRCSNKM